MQRLRSYKNSITNQKQLEQGHGDRFFVASVFKDVQHSIRFIYGSSLNCFKISRIQNELLRITEKHMVTMENNI